MSKMSTDVPTYPLARECPFDPPKAFVGFRESEPVKRVKLWDGSMPWIVTRYDDVRSVLTDDRFSASPLVRGFPFVTSSRTSVVSEEPQINHIDPPAHTALRRMLTREFMIKRIEAMRSDIEQIVAENLEALIAKGAPADFVEHFSLPIPSAVIAKLIGVAYEDHEFFQERALLRLSTEVAPEVSIRAGVEMAEYFDRLFAQKERNPEGGDDIVSRLTREQILPGHLSRKDAVTVCALLLQAGHDTTGNMISLGTLMFLTHPAQRAQIIEKPELVPNAVEELLRYLSIVQHHVPRVALQDVEIGGQVIRAGDGVFALLNAANRDPSAFENPDEFDITRQAKHHIAFSYGVHQCLGQILARIELQTVFARLFQRLPHLKLATTLDALQFKNESLIYGLVKMPVSW